ncbi:MAG: antitermination protein NusB [Flavobacterium sp.]|nr:antitermination protein NusB [Flavobacterium sp.]
MSRESEYKMKKQIFSAVIVGGEKGGAGITIPFDVKKIFGMARAKVKVTIDKFTYPTTVFVMGGQYLIGVRKEIRTAIGKEIGDKVKIIIVADTEERIVVVPEDLLKALNKNKTAKEIFNNFAYTHRKEYVQWVESAKKPETRTNRIIKAVEMISSGKKYS